MRDRRNIGSALVNHIESADGNWFYWVFVKGFIAGFSGWNLGWRLRQTVNVYRGRERRLRVEELIIWWNNVLGLGCLSSSNCWWAAGRCGHSCRPCRYRFHVVNRALMWWAQMQVAENVVIGVFHLKDKVREEQVWAILVGGVESTPWYLTVFAEGVYWIPECRNVESIVSEDIASIKCIDGGAYSFNGKLGGIS